MSDRDQSTPFLLQPEDQKKDTLMSAYKAHNGNVSHVAAELGVHRGSIYYYLKKFGVRT